jgi:DNA ligase-1
LADLFKETSKDEINETANLLLGQLAPSYENVVFNIAERMMLQVLAKAYNKDVKEIRRKYKKVGDLGDVAESLAYEKGNGLTIVQVYKKLYEAAEDSGEGSQDRKVEKVAELLSELDPLSARFVSRIPVGKLRLGFSNKTIIDALSVMEKGDKSAKKNIENLYYVLPSIGLLAEEVKKYGSKKASTSPKPKVGVPVLPMLAQRLKSPSEMVKKMGEVVVEPKLDGLRLQIHFKKGKDGFVKGFTRNLNETSWMFPELNKMTDYVGAEEVIIDTEAVGLDEDREKIANFQTTMTRRRKHEISRVSQKVPIKFYVFDIILRNSQSLMDKTYIERRKVLAKTVKEGRLFKLTDYEFTKNPKEIIKLNKEAKNKGLEGIMIKKANSNYIPGRAGWRWVKMKEAEEELGKLADTVDCIVMGYHVGRGKRAKFGLGGFLVGVLNGEKITTISKIGTGLTDEQFKELKKRLLKLETSQKPKEYGKVSKTLEPDTWVKPGLVVEIAADEITKSPTHSSGYALRFPRLVKFRDDKGKDEATTIKEVVKLFKLQKS